ncbi:hypothetical protein KJ925_04810 [Patescibacteria group bacterium]|nr:hypothetical protein [Patescibacteria group bacterium]
MFEWFSVLALPVAILGAAVVVSLAVRGPLGVVPRSDVAPSLPAGGLAFPPTITLVQAPTEDTKPLHARIDSLRAQVATLEQQIEAAEVSAKFWERGGDTRLELIDAELRRLRHGGEPDNNEAALKRQLLTDERGILLLRQEG